MFTNGALRFRNDLDRVMELEERSLKTVAPVEVLAARIDMTLDHDRRPELSGIDRPSPVIGTRDDSPVPFYFSGDLAKAIPGARLEILEEAGRYSYRRPPGIWNSLIEDYLASVQSGQ